MSGKGIILAGIIAAIAVAAAPPARARRGDGWHASNEWQHGRLQAYHAHRRVLHVDIDDAAASRCDFMDAAVCLYPFPDDYFTRADADADTATGRRVNIAQASMPANLEGVRADPTDWNRADGFSPGSAIVVRIPGLDTPAAYAANDFVAANQLGDDGRPNSPVVVLDTTTGRRWPVWEELDRSRSIEVVNGEPTQSGAPPSPGDTALIIRPAVNFREGHRYIVALRDLVGADGRRLQAPLLFRVYRDRIRTDDPVVEARRPHMEQLLETLQRNGIPRRHLYLAWDFTVASEHSLAGRMLSIRDRAFVALGDDDLSDLRVEGDSPSFTITSVTDFAPCGSSGCQAGENDATIRRVEGTLTVPCYLDQSGCPPGAGFSFAPGSDEPERIPGNVYHAGFICNIPRSAVVTDAAGQVTGVHPARATLYGHGLFGSDGEVNNDYLATQGDRNDIMFCATNWIGMSAQDVPNAVAGLMNIGHWSTVVDRAQQGMLDFLYLARAMIHPQGFSASDAFRFGGQSVIDTRRAFYDGNSQGGIMGGSLTAVAPDFTRAVLGVTGMNYSTLIRRSADGGPYLYYLYSSYPDRLRTPLVLDLMQMLWDRGEADGYAWHMTGDPLPDTPRHKVLMQIGYGDHQVTNWSAEVEARTIGAAVRTPILDPGRSNEDHPFWGIDRIWRYPYRGNALFVWDTGPVRQVDGTTVGTAPPPVENVPDSAGRDPHEAPRRTLTAQQQASAFLRIGGVVIDPCGAHPCYAGDWTGP